MTTKRCFKCEAEKPLSEFYRHKAMADGHLGKCKECTKADVHAHRHGSGRDRVLAYDLARASDPKRLAHRSQTVKAWRQSHPDRSRAQVCVAKALKSGLLTKTPCHICGSDKSVAHHPDYSRPLDVVWLCQAHHKQAHALVEE